jgi:hypothetical protein
MGGKASIFMVLGFSLIFMVAGYNFSSLTNRAVDNEANYFSETKAHDIAVTGANIASNKVWVDKTWTGQYNDVSINNGLLNIKVSQISYNDVQIISVGTYKGSSVEKVANDTIKVLMRPMSYAQFGYYMNNFPGNLFFYTGDVIYGTFHTQGRLRVKGSPKFWGRATAKKGIDELSNNPTTNPIFNGGYESGVDIPLEWDPDIAKTAAQSNGCVFSSGNGKPIDVRLVFNADATVTFSTKIGNGSWSSDSTIALSTLTPNGVIFIDKGNVYMKGTINGRYTVAVDQSSGNGTGNVFLEGDLVYHDPVQQVDPNDPHDYPGNYKVLGDDMLGIVCSNNIEIVNNAENQDNININAAIFSYKGGLEIEDKGMPASGYINLVGSLTEFTSLVTGVVSGSTIVHGYNERIYFDQRFRTSAPPYYPLTGKLIPVTWYESTWFAD